MEENKEKKLEEKLTENQLDALYFYLALNADEMTEEELQTWKNLMAKLDIEFYEY